MAIAFKPPEIPTIGHYHHQPQQAPSPPPSPPPAAASASAVSTAVLQNNHQSAAAAVDSSITVTDSVPRSVIVQAHHQQPILVPQSVVFHPIPPIFLVPQSPPSPPPSPVYRIVGPRQPCPPAERCAVCKDIERVSLLVSIVVLNLVL